MRGAKVNEFICCSLNTEDMKGAKSVDHNFIYQGRGELKITRQALGLMYKVGGLFHG